MEASTACAPRSVLVAERLAVLLRRPELVLDGAASASVTVGELVSLQASASDATSGLAGAGRWTWGDNTAPASGDAVAHTYT